MVAQAISARRVGLRLGLRVSVVLSLLASPVVVAPGCLVTTGPGASSLVDASTGSRPASSGGGPATTSEGGPEAASMTSDDPQNGGLEGGSLACPATRPASCPSPGAACSQVGANCVYDDWCCTCGDGMKQWYCAQTDAPDPCPKEAPEAGTRCSLDTVGCMYCTPKGLLTAACGNDKTITYFAPQCESTIPPPSVVVDAGSPRAAAPAGTAGPSTPPI